MKTSLTLLDEFLNADFEDIENESLTVFYATSIFNPYGPTFEYLAAVGHHEMGRTRRLVHVMLNPFRQKVTQVGSIAIAEDFDPQQLDGLFKFFYGDCPSLFLLSRFFDSGAREQSLRQIFQNFDEDAIRVSCAFIDEYYGTPWPRASAAFGGLMPANVRSFSSASDRLISLSVDSVHVWNEIWGLLNAWRGSIEDAGIGEDLKRTAFPFDRFKDHLINQVLPLVSLPSVPEQELTEPAPSDQRRYKAETVEDLRSTLRANSWNGFTNDQLADLLNSSIALYGLQTDVDDIPSISALYRQSIERGVDVDTRLMIEMEILSLVEGKRLSPAAFLPFLVCDPSSQVASKAAIDFVSESSFVNGELYAFAELRPLLKKGVLANGAAVFGGVVAIGDASLVPFLDEIWPGLAPETVQEATRVHTQFLKHVSIQYWLKKCEELVSQTDEDAQRKFGSCAAALILCLGHAQERTVSDTKRNFPCHASDHPVSVLRTWTVDEYAELIAPVLYRIEAQETAPKLFADVLREWGLAPASGVQAQYIPPSTGNNGAPRALRDLSEPNNQASSPVGFLGRLLGKR